MGLLGAEMATRAATKINKLISLRLTELSAAALARRWSVHRHSSALPSAPSAARGRDCRLEVSVSRRPDGLAIR